MQVLHKVFSFKINQFSVCCGPKTHNKMKTKKLYVGVSLGLAQLVLLNSSALAQERPASNLDEVVVVGYGTMKKKDITYVIVIIFLEMFTKINYLEL